MGNLKNFVAALVLSTLVLLGWQYFYANPKISNQLALEHAEKLEQEHKHPQMHKPEMQIVRERDDVLKETSLQRVKIYNTRLEGTIDLVGARFDDLVLREYKKTMDAGSQDVTLLSPSGTENTYFSEFGWVCSDPEIKVPDSHSKWHASSNMLAVGRPIQLLWDNEQGVRFILDITLDEHYMFHIKQIVENNSGKALAFSNYGLVNKVINPTEKTNSILHEGALGVFNGVLKEVTKEDLESTPLSEFKENKAGDWLGLTDKYWLTALVPGKQSKFNAEFLFTDKTGKKRAQASFITHPATVHSGHKFETDNFFFAGAKKLKLLDQYSTKHNITLFDRAIDFGWFYFITKPMFYALQYFNSFLGNFGLAILLLTVFVKLLMYPMASKSFHSMSQMKHLQPEIARIKERCGNDRMSFNKEIMELYKARGINPLSGCLPLLIQIPVFFSLYKVLFVTIEMRHSPFYGWIKDLSAPDPTSLFNLFGLIPWTPPLFLAIGIWPIIMAITMYVQQQMNPPPTDPVQAQMMKFLPLIFVFMFSSLPAGLIIYWAWNNSLSILQQWWITRNDTPNTSGSRWV